MVLSCFNLNSKGIELIEYWTILKLTVHESIRKIHVNQNIFFIAGIMDANEI